MKVTMYINDDLFTKIKKTGKGINEFFTEAAEKFFEFQPEVLKKQPAPPIFKPKVEKKVDTELDLEFHKKPQTERGSSKGKRSQKK